MITLILQMIWKIIISIFMWIIYIVSALSILFVVGLLFKILVWNPLKKLFKKDQDKEILEENPFEGFGR